MNGAGRLTCTIGRMRVSEAPRVARLVRAVVLATPYYNERAKSHEISKYGASGLRAMIREDPDSVLVARQESRVVGFGMSRLDDGLLWLSWIGIDAAHRGRGLGRALLRAMERSARSRGCHKVWCDCRTTNTASARMLESSGYARLATVRQHWYRQDFILWQKRAP
jgi:ribosomal protein S18 acetylase RimI-like enzyme